MKMVTMLADMRPYRANENRVLPDKVADFLIEGRNARLNVEGSKGLQPDDPAPPAPALAYRTRIAKPARTRR